MVHPELTLDSIVQRDADVIAAEAGRDIVMICISNGLYYGVSDIAREIWEVVGDPIRVSDIIDKLISSYDINRSSCEEQTLSFLRDLISEGLLRIRDGETS
jgi:hypothetical protein